MPSSIIEQDPYEREKFGQYLVSFEDNMRNTCKSLKGHIDEARDNMQDQSGQDALQLLEELVEEIEGGLNGVSEFGTRQVKLAQYIIEAQDKRFHR